MNFYIRQDNFNELKVMVLTKQLKMFQNKFKNDAGLNYDRLKWRRKRGRVDSSAEILLKLKIQRLFS